MLSNLIIGILAMASSEGGGTLLDVNPGLIFWTVITFLILMFILKKVAWKPILTALDERESAIKESLEKAEKAKEDAQKLVEENKANMAKAEEEAKKIIEQSKTHAEKLKEQIVQESRTQAQKLIADASQEIERKKDEAFNELKNQVAEIAIKTAEKLMSETLDKESHKKIVNKYIQDLTKN